MHAPNFYLCQTTLGSRRLTRPVTKPQIQTLHTRWRHGRIAFPPGYYLLKKEGWLRTALTKSRQHRLSAQGAFHAPVLGKAAHPFSWGSGAVCQLRAPVRYQGTRKTGLVPCFANPGWGVLSVGGISWVAQAADFSSHQDH